MFRRRQEGAGAQCVMSSLNLKFNEKLNYLMLKELLISVVSCGGDNRLNTCVGPKSTL